MAVEFSLPTVIVLMGVKPAPWGQEGQVAATTGPPSSPAVPRYIYITIYDRDILFFEMTRRTPDHAGMHAWLVLMKAHRTLSRHARRSIEAADMCLSDFQILE